jgi:surfeit locus 1 family protein
MRIGNYQFKPRLLPSLMVLILLPVLLRLGFWQLARADQKRAILAAQSAKLALPPKIIDRQFTDTENLEFRRLEISGTFLNQYQIFIDNKVHQGEVGYDVVTPLQIKNSKQFVLVNRGWVPQGESRAVLPVIDTPAKEVSLVGIAKYHPKDVVSFGAANRSNKGWPAVVRWIDIKALQTETKLDLLPFLLLLDPKSQYGFVCEWTFVNMPPEKHVSYAVQWFGMAAVLLVIYLVVNLKRTTKSEIRDE